MGAMLVQNIYKNQGFKQFIPGFLGFSWTAVLFDRGEKFEGPLVGERLKAAEAGEMVESLARARELIQEI